METRNRDQKQDDSSMNIMMNPTLASTAAKPGRMSGSSAKILRNVLKFLLPNPQAAVTAEAIRIPMRMSSTFLTLLTFGFFGRTNQLSPRR